MKPKMIVPMLPLLLAMFAFSGREAKAFDVGVSVGTGHHYHHGGVIEYRTTDPVYSTWYPDSTTTYVYPSDTVTYDYGYDPYVYSTNTVDFGGWYGGGRIGHGGHYGEWHGGGRGWDHGHRR